MICRMWLLEFVYFALYMLLYSSSLYGLLRALLFVSRFLYSFRMSSWTCIQPRLLVGVMSGFGYRVQLRTQVVEYIYKLTV